MIAYNYGWTYHAIKQIPYEELTTLVGMIREREDFMLERDAALKGVKLQKRSKPKQLDKETNNKLDDAVRAKMSEIKYGR